MVKGFSPSVWASREKHFLNIKTFSSCGLCVVSKCSENASSVPMSAAGLLGHFGQNYFFSSCWTCAFMSLTGDEVVCLVLYIRCTFIFSLLFWHITTGSESIWRRTGFETKPLPLSIFHLGCTSSSSGPKKVSEMHSHEQGQAACTSANYAWSGNCCLGFLFCKSKIQCNIWVHNNQRRKDHTCRTGFSACIFWCLSWIHAGATSWRLQTLLTLSSVVPGLRHAHAIMMVPTSAHPVLTGVALMDPSWISLPSAPHCLQLWG